MSDPLPSSFVPSLLPPSEIGLGHYSNDHIREGGKEQSATRRPKSLSFLSLPRRIAEKKPHIGNEAARAQWRAEQSVRRGCENRIRSFVSPTQNLDCNVATPLRQRLLGLYVIGPPLCCPCPTPSRAPVFCEWCARTHTLTLTKSKRGSIHPRSTHFLTLPEQVYFYCIGGGYFVV